MSEAIRYTSPNGYTGILGGTSTFVILDSIGREVFHTGFRSINTLEELKERVDGFPEFLKSLHDISDDANDNDDI